MDSVFPTVPSQLRRGQRVKLHSKNDGKDYYGIVQEHARYVAIVRPTTDRWIPIVAQPIVFTDGDTTVLEVNEESLFDTEAS